MTTPTILYSIIAAIFAFIAVLFFYGYQSQLPVKYKWIYGSLRFITLFSILLLLINPKFKKETYSIVKPNLPVLIDNSESIKELNQSDNVLNFLAILKNHKALNEKFELSFYPFGDDFGINDSLLFNDKKTNISKALVSANQLYKNELSPTLLLTDGNQTLGNDYEFITPSLKNSVYPVILGDSTTYTDIKIEALNTNRYAYLKNNFPVEAILLYNGISTITSQFEVKQGNLLVHKETVTFSKNDNSKTVSFTLPASKVGLQKYSAVLSPLSEEKNTINNQKNFAIEVIDQATKVLIVSAISHPDIGALYKSISSNKQRVVTIKEPAEAVNELNEYQLVILYQPDRSFAALYPQINKLAKNTITFTGLETDWNFLNFAQDLFSKEVTQQIENISSHLNTNYGTFAIDDIGFNDFRPLKTRFGELDINVQHELILEQFIDGYSTEAAMLATIDYQDNRSAIFDGEGLWRWRAQSYLNTNSFEDFDAFIGQLVQYLASTTRKSRLTVSAETFYYNNNPITVTAQYFDENYIFDPRKSIKIRVTHTDTDESFEYPMLLKNNFFEVNLSNLKEGAYSYKVSDKEETVSRNGSFTILDFNVEQQFLNANVTKLTNIATNTGGSPYFITEVNTLIDLLVKDDRYQPIQKSEIKTTPLIDWKYILGLIVLTLSLEWFLRKYNGLV